MRKAVIISIVALVLAGCKHTEYVPLPYPDYHDRWLHDSIDRWHTRTVLVQGDTVHEIDTFWCDRWHTDVKHDSVDRPVPYPVHDTTYVKVPPTWWQRTQQGGFWVLIVFVGVLFAARRMRR